MKKKPLSYYLDLIKSAQDEQGWTKAKRYGELALKKLSSLSYSPFEEYLLYCRFAYACFNLAEYSHSIDAFYKAFLLAYKHRLEPGHSAYTSYMMGYSFLHMGNSNQALSQLQKVEQFYQKYRDGIFPMDKQRYPSVLLSLAICYLYKNDLEAVRKIIEEKLPPYQAFIPEGPVLSDYHHVKGEYFLARKEYNRARQSFQESVKVSEQIHFPRGILAAKRQIAVIDLLNGQIDSAIQVLKTIRKDAKRLRFNDSFCDSVLLLSKCYTLKNMPDKSASIESRIKPLLNKLDIVWLYKTTSEFERLYQQLQPIYQTNRPEIKKIPDVLTQTLNRYHRASSYQNIISQSTQMMDVYKLIEKIASTDLPVLIQGETGTGKELIASAIHQNSLRKGKRWLALNCGAVPATLLENELFGHAKGAFTDAHSDKRGYIEITSEGTLFLDEISEMSPAMQQKLLRIMEEKLVWRLGAEKPIPVNTRFIFASNQDIEQLVRQKRFRLDLFHRINTIVINLPSLRNRKDDIPLLVTHFLTKYFSHNRPSSFVPHFSPDALGLFINYPWPGNVRELENEIKRICVLYPTVKFIAETMLSKTILNYKSPSSLTTSFLKNSTDSFQKNLIQEILKKNNGNMTETARQLGLSRFGFYKKMKQLKISLRPDVHRDGVYPVRASLRNSE